MAENVAGVCFVRCPKCLKVLTEFPDVPFYKCGGCGTILRAKNCGSIEENMALGSLENNFQNLSGNGSVNNGSISDSHAKSNCNEKGESSDHGENGIEERGSHSPRPTNQFALRSDPNLIGESQPEEGIRVKPENHLKEEMEKHLKPIPQGRDSSRSSDKMEESSESIVCSVSSEGDAIDREFGDMHGNSLGSTTRSSHAYDGNVSSPDERQRDHVPQKYLLLSKRTFKHKKVLDSVNSVGKEAGEDDLGNKKMTTDVEAQSHARNLPEMSAIKGSIDSKRNELSSRYEVHAGGREISLGSEDFPVQNWKGIGSDGEASRSPSKDPLFHGDKLNHLNGHQSTKFRHLEHNQMKILRKVDELKDELTGLFANTVEGNEASHSKVRLSQIPISAQPHYSCLHCHHEGCCHASKAVHMDSDGPYQHRKAQTQGNEPKKPQRKEKRKPKSYCRPTLRGAPFVICYKCWKLLQLPADFLVSPKRLHKLQCGSCSEILVFSFRPRTHTIPQTPIEAQHPPSEVENSTDAVTRQERSVSNCNDLAQVDPVSYSEDYGPSFVKSYSSKAEPGLHVARNSSDTMEEQDCSQVKDSQRHRLMGYTSASELLFHNGGFDQGYQSTEPSTPHFYRPFGIGTNTPISMEIHEEEDESPERLKTRRRGSALQGLLKKGIRELNHGLEAVKLKAHSNG